VIHVNVATARRRLRDTFREAGLDTPDLDARVLVGHALGLDHAALAGAADRMLAGEECNALDALAARRLAGEPVARIVGWKEFWGLPFRLGPATLVPRPETETVVETALALVKTTSQQPLRIADLGTGSGAILAALLSELPRAVGVGTDLSVATLTLARDNCRQLTLSDRADFVACSFGAALSGGFDLVVSNPPYIKTGDVAGLALEIREHDPVLALDGGPDGLAAYRALAADAARLLAPRGHMVVELGIGADAEVACLFSAAGLKVAAPRPDLAGTPRALTIACPECG
jgi:release factor glutamine methyltransferase